MSTWSRPEELEVVWCRFPYGGHASAARHPCLVLSVSQPDPSGCWVVIVAGGTSANKDGQWTRHIKNTDFVLQQTSVLKHAGLTSATAFQFEPPQMDNDGSMSGGTILTLPYTDEYFVVVYPASTPVVGRVDLGNEPVYGAFRFAAVAASLQGILDQEKARFKANPDVRSIIK